ncbi:MAG: SAM-dependent methyltransferase [Burkholderiaceae bacterium]
MTTGRGTLFLVPTPLARNPQSPADRWLPESEHARIAAVRHFAVETPKVARAWLALLFPGESIRALDIRPLPRGDAAEGAGAPAIDWSHWLAPMLAGHSMGLLSDAGCPGIADPGAPLVAAAHAAGIPVRPLIGPAAIVLALMASGLQGQRFAFHGYLPVAATERDQAIRTLAAQARAGDQTQVLIETPYRNQAIADSLIRVLPPESVLVIAADLTGPTESIDRRTVASWRRAMPVLPRVPATFLFGFEPAAVGRGRSRPP